MTGTNRRDTLDEIEETQSALRESIDTAKKLTDESDRLIEQHRQQQRRDG